MLYGDEYWHEQGQPAPENQAQGPPSRQGHVGCLRAYGSAGKTRRRQRVVPVRSAEQNPELDSSGWWSSGVGAASSDSAASRWSPSPRREGRCWPTASWPARVATRLPRSVVRRPRVDLDLRAVRLPSHREDADFGGDERRRDRDSRSDLARHAAQRPEVVLAHPRGHGVGGGDGSQARQPVRPDRPGARSAGGFGAAHAGVAPSRGVCRRSRRCRRRMRGRL